MVPNVELSCKQCVSEVSIRASSRHSGVEETYTSLKVEAEKMGLVINESKIKYIISNMTTIAQQEQDVINIGGQ